MALLICSFGLGCPSFPEVMSNRAKSSGIESMCGEMLNIAGAPGPNQVMSAAWVTMVMWLKIELPSWPWRPWRLLNIHRWHADPALLYGLVVQCWVFVCSQSPSSQLSYQQKTVWTRFQLLKVEEKEKCCPGAAGSFYCSFSFDHVKVFGLKTEYL